MARRGGKPGDWLAIDQNTGFTRYASQLKKDYWGAYVERPLLRNLQEIASPLSDPYPVPFFTGSDYERTEACIGSVAPTYVGNTTVPTSQQNAAFQVLNLDPSIGQMEIGCTFIIR